MTFLQLHIAAMVLVLALLLTLFRVCNRISYPAMLMIAVSAAGLFVISVNALRLNSDNETAVAILRSELYGVALGETNMVILNREYRLVRVPKAEDDLDNDEVEEDTDGDGIPEIPL